MQRFLIMLVCSDFDCFGHSSGEPQSCQTVMEPAVRSKKSNEERRSRRDDSRRSMRKNNLQSTKPLCLG